MPFTSSYRIDAQDCIYLIDDGWQVAAHENDVADACSLSALKGKSVFSQFSDAETRMIYAKIFARVRASQKAVIFSIHCDALDLIRILEVNILPLPNQHLEVGFRVLKEQARNPAEILDACGGEQPFITMCSYCGDLKNRDAEWMALESEISASDLFGLHKLPKISHGMCPDCAQNFLVSVRLAGDGRSA